MIIINQSMREGRFVSAPFVVPVTGFSRVFVRGIITGPDLDDSANSIMAAVELLDGVTWQSWASFTWRGPSPARNVDGSLFTDQQRQPSISVSIPPPGTTVRVTLDVPAPMRVGAELEWLV